MNATQTHEIETHELDLEDSDRGEYIGRITGTEIAHHNDVYVFEALRRYPSL